MSIYATEDVIGGGGRILGGAGEGSGYGGMFLLAIFLVVLFGMFRGNNWGGNDCGGRSDRRGNGDSIADTLTLNRFANYVDPESSRIHREQAVDTGLIRCDIERQAAAIAAGQTQVIMNANDRFFTMQSQQAADTNNILTNQNRIAFEAMLSQKDDKLTEAYAKIAALEADVRMKNLEVVVNGNQCATNAKLAEIECKMAKMPPVYVAGAYPTSNIMAFNAAAGCGC